MTTLISWPSDANSSTKIDHRRCGGEISGENECVSSMIFNFHAPLYPKILTDTSLVALEEDVSVVASKPLNTTSCGQLGVTHVPSMRNSVIATHLHKVESVTGINGASAVNDVA